MNRYKENQRKAKKKNKIRIKKEVGMCKEIILLFHSIFFLQILTIPGCQKKKKSEKIKRKKKELLSE